MSRSLTEFAFRDDGLEFNRSLLTTSDVEAAIADLESFQADVPACGIRNADAKIPAIARIASSDRLLTYVEALLGDRPQFLRAIAFDKTPIHNWAVPWHQDKTLAVRQRADLSGWGPWTEKQGTLHVQPPSHILEAMTTIRIHLDPADRTNGCLLAIAASHLKGLLNFEAVRTVVRETPEIACVANSGDAIAMRPLLLHASRKAIRPSHRRVIHLEYGSHRVLHPLFFI